MPSHKPAIVEDSWVDLTSLKSIAAMATSHPQSNRGPLFPLERMVSRHEPAERVGASDEAAPIQTPLECTRDDDVYLTQLTLMKQPQTEQAILARIFGALCSFHNHRNLSDQRYIAMFIWESDLAFFGWIICLDIQGQRSQV
jgi:hypothetical protein